MTSEDVDRMLAAHDVALRKIEDGLPKLEEGHQRLEDGFQRFQHGLEELQDAQLGTQRLMELHERQWDERFARLEAKVASHEDGIAEMRAAMNRLFEHMDRFIQGLERGNGKKNGV